VAKMSKIRYYDLWAMFGFQIVSGPEGSSTKVAQACASY